MTTDPSAEVIRLSPLTIAAVAQLLGAKLAATPDPAFVETCMRVTQGTPFLVRELVEAVSEEGSAASEAPGCRSDRCADGRPSIGSATSVAGTCRPARAGARGPRAKRASPSSATRWTRGGRGSRGGRAAGGRGDRRTRPAADVRPSDRSRRHLLGTIRRRARARPPPRRRLLAEQPGATERVAKHLLASEPAADGWVVERLVEAARAAGEARRSRVGGHVPAPGARRAAASRRPVGIAARPRNGRGERWARRLARAPAAWPWTPRRTPAAAAEAAMVLARALSRAHRFAEAVEVLDRAASSLDAATRSSHCCSRLRRSSPG